MGPRVFLHGTHRLHFSGSSHEAGSLAPYKPYSTEKKAVREIRSAPTLPLAASFLFRDGVAPCPESLQDLTNIRLIHLRGGLAKSDSTRIPLLSGHPISYPLSQPWAARNYSQAPQVSSWLTQ